MTNEQAALPARYRATIRTLLRYAAVSAVVAVLVGIVFREATKKIDFAMAAPGAHLEAIIQLGLVHGHVFVSAVLLPIAMAGALVLARKIGGAELGTSLKWATRAYLPFVAVSFALMLLRGYHTALCVRAGETDFGAIDRSFFLGDGLLRIAVYGGVHALMGIGLIVFAVALWRSLKSAA